MGLNTEFGEALFSNLFLEKELDYYMSNMCDKAHPLHKYWDASGDLTGDKCDDMALLLNEVISS